jgi:hypothetical protein
MRITVFENINAARATSLLQEEGKQGKGIKITTYDKLREEERSENDH